MYRFRFFSWVLLMVLFFGFQEPERAMTFEEGKQYTAIFQTDKGEIECLLCQEKAPLSVTNFIQLVNDRFYDETSFYRVIPGFVVQGGKQEEECSYTIPAEIALAHELGALAWARLPNCINPEKRSSGSEFYITLGKFPFLDGDDTVFGQVIKGLDVLASLEEGDKIHKIFIKVR